MQRSTETTTTRLPACDFCRDLARYDGKTTRGTWAIMCPTHFLIHGAGLGPNLGQLLAANGRALAGAKAAV